MNFSQVQSMIKTRVSNLFTHNNIERFTLPPYQEPNLEADPELKKFMTDNNIQPREIYDVLAKFELSASSITKDERILRKKIISKLKEQLVANYETLKSSMATDTPREVQVYLDESKVFMVYVIDMMIQDIDIIENPVTCPECAKCPTCPTCPQCPKSYNMVFGGVIVVLIIIIVFLFLKK